MIFQIAILEVIMIHIVESHHCFPHITGDINVHFKTSHPHFFDNCVFFNKFPKHMKNITKEDNFFLEN